MINTWNGHETLNEAEFKRILIVKPSSLGDVVHALPTFSVLRRRFPQAHIAWLVKEGWAELLDRVEGLNEILSVRAGVGGWLSAIRDVRSRKFDLVVDLQGLFRSGAIAWLSASPVRIGFANAREGGPLFYTHHVAVPPLREIHGVDRNLRVAAALGACTVGPVEFPLRITREDEERVGTLLRQAGLAPGSEWIAMSVSARWATKRYPTESFAALADMVQTQGLGTLVFIGGSEDRAAVEAVQRSMSTKALNLAGRTSLNLLPALLHSAELLVTNDSGPMHVAAALGIHVVAMFGPTSPVDSGPYGSGHVVLRSGIPCSPCFSRTCRNITQLECLHSVSPESVFQAVRQQLASRVAN